jgi:hypothetical protein
MGDVQFNFPGGLYLSTTERPVESFTFALTEADGTRVYGCALHFYEKLSPNSKLIDSKVVSSLLAATAAPAPTATPTAAATAKADSKATANKPVARAASHNGPLSSGASRPTPSSTPTAAADSASTSASTSAAPTAVAASASNAPSSPSGSALRWAPISICITSHWPFYEQFDVYTSPFAALTPPVLSRLRSF